MILSDEILNVEQQIIDKITESIVNQLYIDIDEIPPDMLVPGMRLGQLFQTSFCDHIWPLFGGRSSAIGNIVHFAFGHIVNRIYYGAFLFAHHTHGPSVTFNRFERLKKYFPGAEKTRTISVRKENKQLLQDVFKEYFQKELITLYKSLSKDINNSGVWSGPTRDNFVDWLDWRKRALAFEKGASPETRETFGGLFDAL